MIVNVVSGKAGAAWHGQARRRVAGIGKAGAEIQCFTGQGSLMHGRRCVDGLG